MPEHRHGPAKTLRPSDREMRAFVELLKLVQANGREPTVEEAWPHVHGFFRLRHFTRLGTNAEARLDKSVAPPRQVRRALRGVMRRVSAYLACSESVETLRNAAVHAALLTQIEVLTRGGAYDSNAALAKAKSDAARDVVRLAGQSKEPSRGAATTVNVFGTPIAASELEKIAEARKGLRESQLANRLPGATALN